MSEGNYERIVEKISRLSNLEKEEINRRVEAKRAKLSGLISKEGAAQVIAAELGINFDNEKLKINELLPGMRKVNMLGKVVSIFPVRSFEKNGKQNKVVNMIVADETSNIKMVLWDTNHIGLIETGKVAEGSVVEVGNASVRDNEVHLGSFSEFKISKEAIDNIKAERVVKEKNILDFKISDNVQTRAFVVQAFEPRFFDVCSQCKKKVVQEGDGFVCAEHGKVAPERRALMNIVIDDGTETMRTVVFHDTLKGIGFEDLNNLEEILVKRAELLGKEMVFSGVIRNNKFFNNNEFIVNGIKEVNLDELISELEKKAN
jgi:ssDNA-binding replication factor A large subunit